MRTQDITISTLEDANEQSKLIQTPIYLQNIYDEQTNKRELDKLKGFQMILNQAKNLTKPSICLLGAYSSGKTFLLNYLIQDEIFISKIEPTTAVITIIRHRDDKPDSWPTDRDVFTLKKNVDLRTLNFEHVSGNYMLDDLHHLTTYPEAKQHDAVIVFLDKPILKMCIFYDCPGIGTMGEAIHNAENEFNLSPDQEKHIIREQELQQLAIKNADAHVILGSVIGQAACFADSNLGNVLYTVASNMSRFPTKIPHGNLLFVGSQADPTATNLRDENELLEKLKKSIQDQVEKLPSAERQKFDIAELKKRIVLFYALDSIQCKQEVESNIKVLKRVMSTASYDEIRQEAKAQFDDDHKDLVRTKAFDAAMQTIIEQLLLGIQSFREQITKEALLDGIHYYELQKDEYISRSENLRYYENLSLRYEKESESREADWQKIINSFDQSVSRANNESIQEVRKTFNYWSNQENVYEFLENRFGENKEQAKAYAAKAIADQINNEINKICDTNTPFPQKYIELELARFDRQWLERKKSTQNQDISDFTISTTAGSVPISTETVSAVETFKAFTAAVAGGTTLLAVGGSTLAQAAMVKVLALGVGALGTVGMGGAATGFLVGIPVYGWIAAGMIGLLYGIFAIFAWRKSLAKNIAKSIEKNQNNAISEAEININRIFKEIRELGHTALRKTEMVIKSHISEIHEIGKGHISSRQLEQAAEFYLAHTKLLQQTLNKLKLTWQVNSH